MYKNFDHYISEFCKYGGVIEAAPPLCQLSDM